MTEQNPEKSTVSLTRKIIVLVFIVGFWVFFYWYLGSQTPPSPDSTPETHQEISPGSSSP